MSGILSLLTGGASSIISPVVNKILDFIPDPTQKAQAAAQLQQAMLQADAAMEAQQADIDKTEAGNESIFVSGWRPFIGWVCGAGLAWTFILGPICAFFATLAGSKITLPVFDASGVTALVVPMLGLGAYRTVEKVNGVAGSTATQKAVLASKSST
jgi:hypothetical protein